MSNNKTESEVQNDKKLNYPCVVPAIAIRDVVMFPHMPLPLSVDRYKSVSAIDWALKHDKFVIAVTQKKPQTNEPAPEDLYSFGVLSEVAQSLKMPDGSMKVFLQGIARAKISKMYLEEKSGYFVAEVDYPFDNTERNTEMIALMRHAIDAFETYIKLGTRMPVEVVALLNQIDDPSKLADTISANVFLNIPDKQDLLETVNSKDRLEKLIKLLTKEIEILDIEHKIHSKVKSQIEKSQKEYYLTEQMKAIQKELHQKDDFAKEIDELKKKVKLAKMTKEAETAAEKEISRLSKMMPFSPESTVSRTYLDWLINLPWSVETKDVLDIDIARKVLDEDHFGLKKPKERVLEYLAVCKLTKKLKGPILCFVGPPGTGKTSIAKSIARAMGRRFVRMSLGGVRDEAEIRGHRRTYIASMPGRIMQSIRKAKSKNPVFLLDEIDKMGMDWRGDPAAALLEVLDPEQNLEFMDHFLDITFDISHVMFITTANTVYGIPVSLRDRLEIIEFNGYTHNEKIEIAKKFLVPRQIKEHGLETSMVRIADDTINEIIRRYTKEAGVRNLEREIATLSRRSARKIVEDKLREIVIVKENLGEYLGIPKFAYEKVSANGIGVCTGLAWTDNGGEVITVEVLAYPGRGDIVLTGKLGEVMKESAHAAFSYVKSRKLAPKSFVQSHNFHVHVPEGAVPKDGPSAGITIATALASLFSGKPVLKNLSMTGEITLTGRILPIGGLKEKIIASFREEIMTAIFPKGNEKDLEEIPDEIMKKMKLIGVSSIDEALSLTLEKMGQRRKRKAEGLRNKKWGKKS